MCVPSSFASPPKHGGWESNPHQPGLESGTLPVEHPPYIVLREYSNPSQEKDKTGYTGIEPVLPARQAGALPLRQYPKNHLVTPSSCHQTEAGGIRTPAGMNAR